MFKVIEYKFFGELSLLVQRTRCKFGFSESCNLKKKSLEIKTKEESCLNVFLMSASNTESKFQNTAYCQVPSASLSHIEAHAGSFRLSIKEGKFDVYLL